MPARAIPMAAAILASACTLDFDLAGPHGGGSEGGGGSPPVAGSPPSGGSPATGGAPPSCDGTCVALGRFSGPFLLGDDSCESPLSAGYANATPPFSAAEADCTCACEPPTDLGCADILASLYDESLCAGGTMVGVVFPEGACYAPLLAGVDAYSIAHPVTGGPANASCKSNRSAATKAPVVFTDPVIACEVRPTSCDDSALCLPDNLAGLCVLGQKGDTCPAELPNGREIFLAEELVDGRDCTCECGVLSATCAPHFEIFTDDTCTSADSETLTAGCVTSLDVTHMEGIRYQPLATNVSCGNAAEKTDGTVTPGDARILCCAGD